MIARLVTAYALARDAELLGQRHAFVAFCATLCCDCRRSGSRRLIKRHLDVVNAVTVSAYGRARNATRNCPAVNALDELSAFGLMALPACFRNIDFKNRRLRVRGGTDVVAVVAVGANRRAGIPARNGLRVNTLSIGKKRLVSNPASLHDGFVAVTTTASFGNVSSIDC